MVPSCVRPALQARAAGGAQSQPPCHSLGRRGSGRIPRPGHNAPVRADRLWQGGTTMWPAGGGRRTAATPSTSAHAPNKLSTGGVRGGGGLGAGQNADLWPGFRRPTAAHGEAAPRAAGAVSRGCRRLTRKCASREARGCWQPVCETITCVAGLRSRMRSTRSQGTPGLPAMTSEYIVRAVATAITARGASVAARKTQRNQLGIRNTSTVPLLPLRRALSSPSRYATY